MVFAVTARLYRHVLRVDLPEYAKNLRYVAVRETLVLCSSMLAFNGETF